MNSIENNTLTNHKLME